MPISKAPGARFGEGIHIGEAVDRLVAAAIAVRYQFSRCEPGKG
jgi:hypothetical protein